MKALILNSGMGSRMGDLTSQNPKCMTEISDTETILSRQLRQLAENGIKDIVVTTGYFNEQLVDYCNSMNLGLNFEFVHNSIYDKTNYIYSIYCAREQLKDEDIVLMHGDLVFENFLLEDMLKTNNSCMTVSSTIPLPEKDFKAVINGNKIEKVGIEFFDNAVAAQPLYKLNKKDWNVWLSEICSFCEADVCKCYAENAFNQVSDKCDIYTFDVKDALCGEIDNSQDLEKISERLKEIDN